MFGWLKGFFGKAASSVSLISPYLRSVVWSLRREYITLAREAYGGNSAVYACLRVLSTSIAEPPLLAEQLDATETKTPLAFDHSLMKLIRNPNPLQTEYEFWEMVGLHTGIVGISHWWKQRDRLGRPIALWPLRPDRVSPKYAELKKDVNGNVIADATTNPMQVLDGWAYWQPGLGTAQILPEADVLTFNFPDPTGESGGLVEGMGPLQVLAREAEVDNEMTAFTAALLRNSATPGIIITVNRNSVAPNEAKDIKRGFMAQFGGPHRGEPAVVDGDTKITEMGFSPQQLEAAAFRNFTESRITAGFGVPAILVGLDVGINAAIKATIAEQREFFAETTLSNLWRRFSDQYTKDVAAEFGDGIVCRFDLQQVKALATQLTQSSLRISDGFAKGAVTYDEYRVKVLGLPPIGGTWGQSVYLPAMTTPTPTTEDFLAVARNEQGDDAEVSGDGTEDESPTKRRRLRLTTKAVVPDPQRDADEEALRTALADLFDGVQDDVASRIRRHEYVSDTDLAAAFQKVLDPVLREVFLGAFLRIAARTGVEYDPAEASILANTWATTYVPQMITGLTETTRQVVTSAVTAYRASPSMTIGELRAQLEPAFSSTRSQVVAVTECTRAHTQAFTHYRDLLAESGVSTLRQWNSTRDELQCPLCGGLNGKTEDQWPADAMDGPPRHVNCRCFLTLASTTAKAVGLVRVA